MSTLELTEHEVDIDGISIHVTDVGEGDPIVLLHGGGVGASAMANFRSNVPNLAARHRLLLIDQPGFAGSSKSLPEGESYLRVAARCVLGVMDHLGIATAHLLGNSLGGATCLRVALDHPERVDRLVLMGPGGGAVNLFTPGQIIQGVIQSVMRFHEEPTLERMREFVDFMVFDPASASDELVLERFEAAVDPETMAFMSTLFTALAVDPEADLWKEVHRIPHPTLLLWGREDPVLPFESCLLMFHRMPDVRLVAFADCGHWVQAEKQPAFDAAVLDFLA